MMFRFILLGLTALLLPNMASAQVTVFGSGAAKDCYLQTKTGDPGRISTIQLCESALDEISLSQKNRVATYVNIGILNMRAGRYKKANSWYERALNADIGISETYINYAASLIYMGAHEKAIKYVSKAIELGTDKMPEALYNRAIAYDYTQNYRLAYKDLKRALELKPDWPPAIKAINNYSVQTKPKGLTGS